MQPAFYLQSEWLNPSILGAAGAEARRMFNNGIFINKINVDRLAESFDTLGVNEKMRLRLLYHLEVKREKI